MAYTEENLNLALSLAAQGRFVFPCRGFGDDCKKPCYGILSWPKQSTTDPDIVRDWWRRWPDAVPAIDHGRSGLLTFDLDRGGKTSGRAWLLANVGDVDAPGCDTPSGGRHLTYLNRKDNPFGNGRGNLPPRSEAPIDVRGDGGYTIAGGSRFRDGGYYAPRGDLRDVQPLPDWAIALLTVERPAVTVVPCDPVSPERALSWGESALDGMCTELAATPEGNRNTRANEIAFRAGRMVAGGLLAQSEVRARLTAAAMATGLPAREAASAVASGLKAGISGAGGKAPPITGPENDLREFTADPKVLGEESHETPNLGVLGELGADAPAGEERPIPESDPMEKTPPKTGGVSSIAATPFILRDGSLIPQRQWLYGTHLIRKFCSATVAHGAVGKSNLMIVEALAMVTGSNLMGVLPRQKLRVWYWNGEDPYEEIERRITAASQYFGITLEDIGGRLFVNSGRDPKSKIVIAKMGRFGVEVSYPPVFTDLKSAIRDNAIDVLMIDPFIKSHKVTENDNNAIDEVAARWSQLADETDTGIDLAHHSKKTSGNAVLVEDSRGASALLAAVRSARTLNTMTEKEANDAGIHPGQRKRYFRVTNGKLNLAPPPEQDDWCYTVSVDLGNGDVLTAGGEAGVRLAGDSVGVVTSWKYPTAKNDDTEENFAKVAEVIKAGQWRKDSRAEDGTWVGLAVGRALALRLPGDKAKIKKLLKAWLASGMLVVVAGQDTTRRKRDFIEVASLQPGSGVVPEEGSSEGGQDV